MNGSSFLINALNLTMYDLNLWVWHAPRPNIRTSTVLIYINELSKAIIFSSVHDFSNVSNILGTSFFLKDINKKVNFDLFNIVQWLSASKMSFVVRESLNIRSLNILISAQVPRKVYPNIILDI